PSWGWLRAASRSAAAFTPAALAGVELPLLLLATQADRLVGVDAIRRVASWLPRAELEIFQTSAHEILREADRVRLAAFARIDEFLEERAR
ncbi:MAG: alpha/beta hydrolase, partial [Sphingosinicella sp.]